MYKKIFELNTNYQLDKCLGLCSLPKISNILCLCLFQIFNNQIFQISYDYPFYNSNKKDKYKTKITNIIFFREITD